MPEIIVQDNKKLCYEDLVRENACIRPLPDVTNPFAVQGAQSDPVPDECKVNFDEKPDTIPSLGKELDKSTKQAFLPTTGLDEESYVTSEDVAPPHRDIGQGLEVEGSNEPFPELSSNGRKKRRGFVTPPVK